MELRKRLIRLCCERGRRKSKSHSKKVKSPSTTDLAALTLRTTKGRVRRSSNSPKLDDSPMEAPKPPTPIKAVGKKGKITDETN